MQQYPCKVSGNEHNQLLPHISYKAVLEYGVGIQIKEIYYYTTALGFVTLSVTTENFKYQRAVNGMMYRFMYQLHLVTTGLYITNDKMYFYCEIHYTYYCVSLLLE